MKISAIVAVSQNGIIGKNGHLPWHLSADLKRFKALTSGYTILLGRKITGTSGARSRTARTSYSHATRRFPRRAAPCHTLAEALDFARKAGAGAFIIGGAQIYALAMPFCEKLYLTRVLRKSTMRCACRPRRRLGQNFGGIHGEG